MINKRVSIYDFKTRHLIPNRAGVYGWFVPLWLWPKYKTSNDYVDAIAKIFMYEPTDNLEAKERTQEIAFNWEKIDIDPTRKRINKDSETVENFWQKMQSDEKMKKAFGDALMEASLLLPPIYVGQTENLLDRYDSHIKGSTDRNDFHKRFKEYVKNNKIDLRLDELIFAAIPTPKIFDEFGKEESNNLHKLLEQVIMRISGPAFSLK
jgi:hypothetical protein